MKPQLFESRPTAVWASPPVTAQNRDHIATWIRGWGGKVTLIVEGSDVALVVHTISGEADVRYGDRVLYNDVDFYPCAPAPFEARWAPTSASDASA